MRKTILTLIFALATITFCNAQKIEMEKVFGGYTYTQNGNQMTMKDLVKTMESNKQAFDLIKKAQSNNTLASIIGFAGGGLIGWPIGTAVGGGDANWTLAGIGAGLVAIGIPISSSVNKKAKQAVELYNSSLNSTSFYEFKPEFKILANGNGIGLSINF
jgi:outer membrane lipoprotein SlyB